MIFDSKFFVTMVMIYPIQPGSNSGQAEDRGCCRRAQLSQRISIGKQKGG